MQMSEKKIVVIVQARMSSSRLPAKALLPIGGEASVILCARRAGNAGLPVVVATSLDQADDALEKVLCNGGIKCYRGALDDVLGRLTQAVSLLKDSDVVIRLTADNVFPDGAFLNMLLGEFDSEKMDYLGTSSPFDGLPYGLSAEIFTVSVLREADRYSYELIDREHVTPYIKRNFRCVEYHSNYPWWWASMRCTLDTFKDYTRLLRVFEHVKKPLDILWLDLVEILAKIASLPMIICPYEKLPDGACGSKLTLGAVQLGLSYGVANETGLPKEGEAKELIEAAINSGIMAIDTARDYGLSEKRVGEALGADLRNQVSVITKLHPLNYMPEEASDDVVKSAVRASIFESCYELGEETIDTLLLHRWEHRFKWRGAVWEELKLLKQRGIITKLGASVATLGEAIAALNEPLVQHIQCPINLLDWRWAEPKFLLAIKKRPDVIVHARSVFLQGLLLMPADQWPGFKGVDVSELNGVLDDLVIEFDRENRADLCLAYVRGLPWVTSLVLGMETKKQLHENLKYFENKPLTQLQIEQVWRVGFQLPESFLNPALWRR